MHRLFWGGVGLAPLAVLLVLFGSSTGAMRLAVTLSVLTIVLLAVSIAMRPSVEMIRVDIEHRFLDEVERVRAHSRHDVTTAARNTHRVLSEKIRTLTETIEWLREQLDEVHAAAVLGQGTAADGGSHAEQPGTVRRTETVQVTRRTTTVGGERGTVYGSPAGVPAEGRHERRYDDRSDDGDKGWEASADRWASVRSDDGGQELRMGERRSSVRSDERGSEYRVEDRWAALRQDDEPSYRESDWESTLRSLSSDGSRPGPTRALPTSRGEAAARYLDGDYDDVGAPMSRGRLRDGTVPRQRGGYDSYR